MRERSKCGFDLCDRDAWARGFCAKHYYHAQRHGLIERPACSVDGCDKPSFRRGMCNTHNLRWERHGDVHYRKKAANGEAKNSKCSIDGCERPCQGRGLCSVHIGRLRHHGDPNAVPTKLGNGQATPERKKDNTRRAMKNYQATTHGKLRRRYATAKRRILAGICGSSHIKKEQFLELWATETCAICSLPVSDKDKSVDHIVPLSRGGTNEISNMQITHLRCNQKKGNRVPPVVERASS